MSPAKSNEPFETFLRLAADLSKAKEADAIFILLEGRMDWAWLRKKTSKQTIVLASDDQSHLEGAEEAGFGTIWVNLPTATVYEKLNQALLDGIAKDLLSSRAEIVAIYSAYDPGNMDSVSFLRLDERLGRLSARDLRRLETTVPLETLKLVVDLAVEIGREGREGKPVGTMMVVGDHRNVQEHSQTIAFDPVKGYKRAERSIRDASVREALKEIALMDGAFIIAADGTVVAACQMLETGGTGSITISKGLGTRHWAGAAISKKTKAIAVVISESNGSVRIFQNGEVMLRIEPGTAGRRPMTWKELDPTDPHEDDKKPDGRRSDSKKSDLRKSDTKKSDTKRPDQRKSDPKRSDKDE